VWLFLWGAGEVFLGVDVGGCLFVALWLGVFGLFLWFVGVGLVVVVGFVRVGGGGCGDCFWGVAVVVCCRVVGYCVLGVGLGFFGSVVMGGGVACYCGVCL